MEARQTSRPRATGFKSDYGTYSKWNTLGTYNSRNTPTDATRLRGSARLTLLRHERANALGTPAEPSHEWEGPGRGPAPCYRHLTVSIRRSEREGRAKSRVAPTTSHSANCIHTYSYTPAKCNSDTRPAYTYKQAKSAEATQIADRHRGTA